MAETFCNRKHFVEKTFCGGNVFVGKRFVVRNDMCHISVGNIVWGNV